MTNVLIIGGSDAGISGALRARAVDPAASVRLLLADSFPNYSICGIPFYLSGEVSDWHQLAHRTHDELKAAGIDVQVNTEALEIDPQAHRVMVRPPHKSREFWAYDRLLIATGAQPIRPLIAGLDGDGVFTLHTMAESFQVSDYLEQRNPRRAVIIGAGYIGLEMADALSRRGLAVTVVEQAPTVLPTVDESLGTRLAQRLLQEGVSVYTGVRVRAIERVGTVLSVIGNPEFTQTCDMVIVVVGVQPESQLAQRAGVRVGVHGAICVTKAMETNLADIYAAGDCVETYHRLLKSPSYLPLGTTAHKQGRVAGENLVGGRAEFAGSLGTQVVKVFDWAIARSGLTQTQAAQAGYQPLTVELTAWDHKAYYPGAHELVLRITGDVATGRLLGAQILGHWQGAVAKRIDLFAFALFHRMSVAQMLDVDLSYTPPLGSPWDAVQMACEHWLQVKDSPPDIRG